MDTTSLRTAYTGLLDAAAAAGAAAQAGRPTAEPPGEPGAERTLAHVALGDRLLAAAARRLLEGATPSVDNAPAVDPAAIDALTSSAGHDVLADLVRRNAAELLGLVERLPDDAALRLVRVRLVDGSGREAFSGEVPWGELLRVRAEEHLPGHADRLRRLAAAG
ncbi:hypothetical protein [Streptomyces sp. NPDC001380]|uniref:hypothetical protein n=1 Tax=Streptomyces sp. NPDC001380 TaxID=3364566 RepID=UPI003687327F